MLRQDADQHEDTCLLDVRCAGDERNAPRTDQGNLIGPHQVCDEFD